ncbi:helix-turn-helix domain-containing protein [Methylophaga sp. OBS3]|uniref:helix-turn-helix domain-containing protein n=1 Tax=Methylophaga sp. OBS3 TaxID=2991934 RepID=UPI00224D0DB0|nr:helix-turn-helix domain-containing protein [Methylophaga sp. OBS3]MCX4190282.1 helix-turn-helix domain-containing protein [Methylophaga sp. OBS3]
MATNNQILARIGESLREHRLHRDFSQKRLAEKAGVSLSTIKRLESGLGCDMSNFIDVMRGLGRLSDLEQILPEITLKPTELLKLRRQEQENKKQRASRDKS